MYLVKLYVTNASLMIDKAFTYYSDFFIEKYKRVEVHFNQQNPNIGFVVECEETFESIDILEEKHGFKIKPILKVIDEEPVLSSDQFQLAKWLSYVYVSPLISCINTILPKYLKTNKKIEDAKKQWHIKKNHNIDAETLTKKQKEFFDMIIDNCLYSDCIKKSPSITKKLLSLNYIEKYEQEKIYPDENVKINNFKTLKSDQQKVVNDFKNSSKQTSLLYGVTGSGKTEVYLHIAKEYIENDKQVLILVPEISLTPLMISRVKEHFNDVIFYHSELNDQEKYEQYQRVLSKNIKIVVGTRSAVFLPFSNLGLIVVDEEHDHSYKQDKMPCYNVIQVAKKRCNDFNAKLLLGSATPSLNSYNYALYGKYELLKLTKRINNYLPNIEFVNMRKEIKQNHNYILSTKLKQELIKCIENNKQAIVILNKRGYSTMLKCLECGETLMCDHCDIALRYHKDENCLKCHKCSAIYNIDKKCKKCNSSSLVRYGFGCEQLQEIIEKEILNAKCIRMDQDTTTRKNSKANILHNFENKKYNILVGTQMISKGLDIEDVTLVGVVDGDSGLALSDFNSSKLCFDLLMQAAGRSGRSNNQGKVIIQVFNEDNFVLNAVKKQSYEDFYYQEIKYRKLSNHPPFIHYIEILFQDINVNRLNNTSMFFEDELTKYDIKFYKTLKLIKIKNFTRSRILIYTHNLDYCIEILHAIIDKYQNNNYSTIIINIDPLVLN